MMRWIRCLALLIASGVLATTAPAQESRPAGDAPVREELQQAMQQYFQNRLRQALSLSDEQVEKIAPELEKLERSKREARSERQRTLRELQQGLHSGGSDEQLRGWLDRLDAIEREQQALQARSLADIDRTLTVRQQVQLRFFIQSFQREFMQRVRELRGERRPMRGDRPMRRQRPRRP